MSGAFETPAGMLKRYDARVIGMLMNDSGIPVDATTLLTDPNLLQILSDASGLILSYALVGGRYTETDLDALTGISQSILQRLTCDVAIWMCVLRRGLPVSEYAQALQALAMLEGLAAGNPILGTPAAIMGSIAQDPSIPIPTILDENLLRNSIYFLPAPRYALEQGE